MRKGIVNTNLIYLKRGGYIENGKPISETDVDNYAELVKAGKIEEKEKPKADPKPVEEKPKEKSK